MSKPPMKKKTTFHFIILIPIIAFMIGYFMMGMIQVLHLDVKFLDFESRKRLDFNTLEVPNNKTLSFDNETTPEERLIQSTTSKGVQLSEINLYSIQIGSFSTNEQALPAYTAVLKNGYGATIFKNRVMRVLIAASPSRELAVLLSQKYDDDFESLSIENVTMMPKCLILDESEDPTQIVKAAEILSKLLLEAVAYMANETITPHKNKEKKVFLKSQADHITNGKQTIEQTYLNAALSGARDNILQIFDDHERYLRAWSDKRSPIQTDLWQGLLSELMLYEQIIR